MPSIGDLLLTGGCAVHVERLHGETIRVLTGAEAGGVYVGVRETETDLISSGEIGEDPRARRIIRFPVSRYPVLASQDVVQTDDNKKWKAVKRPDSAFLSIDYELTEIVPGKDT